MNSIFQPLMSALLGLILAAYGLFHAARGYPEPGVFAKLFEAMPTLGRVLFFALGVVIALAGLVLLAVSVRRLRRRWLHRRAVKNVRAVVGRRDLPAPRRVFVGGDYDRGYDDGGYPNADDRGDYSGDDPYSGDGHGEAGGRDRASTYR